ncbi:MAG: hypothetical protein O3B13_23880 [Planctomycetota bacterium]|nr:hypothetical protein [Planctomycetota bacterium]
MLSGWLLALSVAASPGQCTTCGPGGGMQFSPGMASGSFVAGQGGFSNPYDSVSAGGGGGGDQLYPFDSPEPWLHGYFQELPAHAGYASFRPHNYKHVLAQMEVAGRWGMSPVLAYSHQWYHRFRQRSGMHPNFGMGSASLEEPSYGNVAQYDEAAQAPVQQYANTPPPNSSSSQMTQMQQASAFQRGYTDTAIPGITTPFYQRPLPQPVVAPIASVSAEYLERMDQLQKQLEEQTFQMQLMQQQMLDKKRLPEWQQPNHTRFQEVQTAQEPRQLQQFATAPVDGYQELQAPGAFSQQGAGQPAVPQASASQSFAPQNSAIPQAFSQQGYGQQGYPQTQSQYQGPPQYQTQPQYQTAPAQGYPQNYGVHPDFQQQQMMVPTGPNGMNPVLTVPQQGPNMQLPPGQAYFSSPQNAVPGYSMQPQQQPIAGTHAVWQQNSPQVASGPAYSYGPGAQPSPYMSRPPEYQQSNFAQQSAWQQPVYQQPAYQQMPASAAPGQFYRY